MTNLSFSRLPPTRNEQVSVGTSNVILSEPRSEIQPRTAYMILNTSPTKGTDLIYVRLGSDGTANNTLWVLDVGDSIQDSNSEGYICHQDTISVICATANGKVNIIER